MPSLTTLAKVRAATGLTTDQIPDADGIVIINETERNIERYLNCKFIPVTTIDIVDGTGTEEIKLRNNPVLKIRFVKTYTSVIDPEDVYVYRDSGVIKLSPDAAKTDFYAGDSKPQQVMVKYDYGLLERDMDYPVGFVSGSNLTSGSNVTVNVSTTSGISAGSYVRIYGTDGYDEVATVTSSTLNTSIIVDSITVPHEKESLIEVLNVPPIAQRLATVTCSLAWMARFVGESFDEITGYGLGELNVQKGEPWVQIREASAQFIKERDEILSSLRQRPAIF